MKTPITIVIAQVALFIPLAMWRWIYPVSDWAVLPLLILWLMLCKGTYVPAAATYRARLSIELRSESFLSNYLTGRFHAGIAALVFSFLAMPVLAWQALTVTPAEATGFIVLGIFSSVVVSALHAWLGRHFTPWVARSASISIAAIFTAVIFVPVLACINWYYTPHPAEILDSSIADAISITIDDLPQRRGWVAEILGIFYAFDGAKLWLSTRFGSSGWITGLYSLDAAFTGFILARSSAILTSFLSDELINFSVMTKK
jgi:hypothetical protein